VAAAGGKVAIVQIAIIALRGAGVQNGVDATPNGVL
jgi:hypothetical protein